MWSCGSHPRDNSGVLLARVNGIMFIKEVSTKNSQLGSHYWAPTEYISLVSWGIYFLATLRKKVRLVPATHWPCTHASQLVSEHLEPSTRSGFKLRKNCFLICKNSRIFAYIYILTFKHMESYIYIYKISFIVSWYFGGQTQFEESSMQRILNWFNSRV